MKRLPYVSVPVEDGLLNGIVANLPRYKGGGFGDIAPRPDWTLECHYEYNPDPLSQLDAAKSEYENSLLVWQALSTMPVSLACEGRIWSRLSHVECFGYAKKRWLPDSTTDDKLAAAIRLHFFATTMTGRRDDNAIARLWWSASIASRISSTGDISETLRLITKTADIRSNFVERTMMMSRPVLARSVVEVMRRVPAVHEREETFREFMKTLNRTGGGIVFERMQPEAAFSFVENCAKAAVSA